MKFKSHPKKYLNTHSLGVYDKAKKRNLDSSILEIVSLNHDLGKINKHFLNKLNHLNSGYNKHSYLSLVIILYLRACGYINMSNSDIVIISNIVTSHHGNLKNIDDIFNSNEIDELRDFLIKEWNNNILIGLKEYFPKYILNEDIKIELIVDNLLKISSQKSIKFWKDDCLSYYYDTIFNFSQLIEADKRDAGNNEYYKIDSLKEFNLIMDNNLNQFLNNLIPNNNLNVLRTQIRNESVFNLENYLNNSDDRIFTLTSPTGTGKTFILMKLANIIQKIKGDYGIIYGIPFTSIIDQTSNIIESKLLLDILNYTSVSNSSKSIDNIQKKLEYDSNEKLIADLLKENFSEETFDNPFVITTFVQIFETLISNKNSTLLKLPNFSKRIFLIDEIQSLPANLYSFFYGILKHFCEKYDSYAILASATMPNFILNKKIDNENFKIENIFKNFKTPLELLDYEKYYNNKTFNRYLLKNIGEKNISDLLNEISKYETCLIIVNTVKDSYNVYDSIDSDNKYLLNNKFSSHSKLKIINEVKDRLKNKLPTILVSTQLIEAGVDLDFPILFRDLAPLPNIIQSCGRNNREGTLSNKGESFLFKYYTLNEKEEKIFSSEYIYNKWDLDFSYKNINICEEKDLLSIQKKYYESISEWKEIGKCNILKKAENLVKLIYDGKISDIGNFRLIDNSDKEVKHYVGDDSLWIKFKEIYNSKPINGDYISVKEWNIKLSNIHKKISKHIVNVNIDKYDICYEEEVMNIRKISSSLYSEKRGLDVYNNNFNIL